MDWGGGGGLDRFWLNRFGKEGKNGREAREDDGRRA